MTDSTFACNRRVVVLISGNGSNLQAILDAIAAGTLHADLCAVISNRDDAFGLQRAQQANIPTHVIEHKAFPDRDSFDAALIECIDQYDPALVVLAGFLRILTPAFTDHYAARLINIHPSLLPAYPGLNTHEKVLAAGDSEHGASVHFVTGDLDAGPVIIQARVPVLAHDTPNVLMLRVLEQEHKILPVAIQWFLDQRLRFQAGHIEFDGTELTAPVQFKAE